MEINRENLVRALNRVTSSADRETGKLATLANTKAGYVKAGEIDGMMNTARLLASFFEIELSEINAEYETNCSFK